MLTDRLSPGMYGYIDYSKKKNGLLSLALIILVAGLTLTGYFIYGTVKNLISLPALFTAIPFAMFFAAFIAKVKFKTADKEKYAMVSNFERSEMLLSDLIIIDEKGSRFNLQFAVFSYGSIKAFSPMDKKDAYVPEVYLNEKLKKRGSRSRLKIYTDFDLFLKDINGMKYPEKSEEQADIRLSKETVISTCM